MQITIKRTSTYPPSIEGQIYINGNYYADTLEHMQYALPEGEYHITPTYCKHYARKMLLLTQPTTCHHCAQTQIESPLSSLPTFCPMIKPGNGICNRHDGTILIGTRLLPGVLINSAPKFEQLHERIRKSIKRGNTITLTIQSES